MRTPAPPPYTWDDDHPCWLESSSAGDRWARVDPDTGRLATSHAGVPPAVIAALSAEAARLDLPGWGALSVAPGSAHLREDGFVWWTPPTEWAATEWAAEPRTINLADIAKAAEASRPLTSVQVTTTSEHSSIRRYRVPYSADELDRLLAPHDPACRCIECLDQASARCPCRDGLEEKADGTLTVCTDCKGSGRVPCPTEEPAQ
jgi:hypothetical protein